MNYIKNVLTAIDQLIGSVLFNNPCDETLSAMAYRLRLVSPWWRAAQVIIDALFFWQGQHCKQSYISEYERKQLPTEYSKEQ